MWIRMDGGGLVNLAYAQRIYVNGHTVEARLHSGEIVTLVQTAPPEIRQRVLDVIAERLRKDANERGVVDIPYLLSKCKIEPHNAR